MKQEQVAMKVGGPAEEARVLGHGESIGDPSKASWIAGGNVNVILEEVAIGNETKFRIRPWVSTTANLLGWEEAAKKLTATFPDRIAAQKAGQALLDQRERWFLLADKK